MVRRSLTLGVIVTAAVASALTAPAPVLVTAGWLATHLHDANLVILATDDQAAFDAGHIPGARHVPLAAISTTRDGLDLEMPTSDDLGARLAALGISRASRVVVTYGSVTAATRILVTLQYAGLGDNASLLDGGTKAWSAAGHPLATEATAVVPAALTALKIQPIVVDAPFVRAHLNTPHFAIVDARATAFFDGSQTGGTAKRAGHIPGAVNVPYTTVTDENGQFRSAAELKILFEKAGVHPGDTIIGYCHIGQQATAMLTAARLTGHTVLLYDGSFQDWTRRPDYPVENPAGKGRWPREAGFSAETGVPQAKTRIN